LLNKDVSRLLKIWEHLDPDTGGVDEINMIAPFSGIRSLREYLEMHSAIGEPAVRKIARQVLKGVMHALCCRHLRHFLIP
jgi:hypothetical protein